MAKPSGLGPSVLLAGTLSPFYFILLYIYILLHDFLATRESAWHAWCLVCATVRNEGLLYSCASYLYTTYWELLLRDDNLPQAPGSHHSGSNQEHKV